jgi:hypothetical protein
VLSNFPIRQIAESDADIIEIMATTDPAATGNLGLLLDDSIPLPG